VLLVRRHFAGHNLGRLLVAVVAGSLIAAAAFALHSSQRSERLGVESRYAARAGLAANFVSTYLTDLTAREQTVATNTLGDPDPSVAFAQEVAAFGFQAAVLLDSGGRALAVAPVAPQLIGQQLGSKYAHLTGALLGHVTISDVVPSAAKAAPVIAFAVPYNTPTGRRVFSGAYAISATPLTAFLRDTTTLRGARLYLTDGQNTVLATNQAPITSPQKLAQLNPAFAAATATTARGEYRSDGSGFEFVRSPVPGTSWSLLITAPDSSVFVAVNGTGHWLPWVILLFLSLLVVLAALLAIRLLASRRRLSGLNADLALMARTDVLTGLSNRVHMTEQLEAQLANAARHGDPLCVLMIDIDHFKHLNDTYGHQGGDRALRQLAARLSSSLRSGDALGRWGGEEFLAILPHTVLEDGLVVGQRLCSLIAGEPLVIGADGERVTVKTSVGLAQSADDSLDALVHRADLGLYEAKAAGRNTIRVSADAEYGSTMSDV
jgi:diguanylate cyclase (GGDEF)-like protein